MTRYDLRFRPVDPDADAELLHAWVTHPKAVYWMMQDAAVDDVRAEYTRLDAYLGLLDGEPRCLYERYDPAVELAGIHASRPGDVGMHVLAAPTGTPLPGFTRAVFRAVLDELFADPATRRVVVEPDVRNRAVHRLNALMGFRPQRVVQLPAKRALLSTLTREQYRAATGAPPETGHLAPELWAEANRRLVRKALAEFAHERLISPTPLPDGRYGVASDDDTVGYRFRARRLALDHWQIDADSLTRHRGETELPLDACELVLELRRSLNLSDEVLPVYLEEITSTLAATAFKLSRPAPTAEELAADADLQTVEAAMTEGHPCFVANSGRLGFDSAEYLRYAPEAAAPVRLHWVAAREEHAVLALGRGANLEELLADTPAVPSGYVAIPVHPWQWRNRLSVSYAGELASGRLLHLGEGRDSYLPQQSVRTFFNTAAPDRPYVKTALSVLNMGFLRGLSADYMATTPAVNDWLADLVAADPVLSGSGFSILREHAAVGYRHPHYPAGTAQQKMLAALWRESPFPKLRDGERAATMASLLHLDREGNSLAAALIARSDVSPEAWLRAYLDAYLSPILRCYYAYGLVFMPHGENVILALDEKGVPTRAFFKDLAEEIAVLDPELPLPDEISRVRAEVPEQQRILSIVTDVFDCFFRFLAATLDACGALDEKRFWAVVAEQVRAHEADTSALFAERFPLSCLNRLQLRNNRQMVDLTDPAGAISLAGTLGNPLYH
jgi:siderophore synthetase component